MRPILLLTTALWLYPHMAFAQTAPSLVEQIAALRTMVQQQQAQIDALEQKLQSNPAMVGSDYSMAHELAELRAAIGLPTHTGAKTEAKMGNFAPMQEPKAITPSAAPAIVGEPMPLIPATAKPTSTDNSSKIIGQIIQPKTGDDVSASARPTIAAPKAPTPPTAPVKDTKATPDTIQKTSIGRLTMGAAGRFEISGRVLGVMDGKNIIISDESGSLMAYGTSTMIEDKKIAPEQRVVLQGRFADKNRFMIESLSTR